MPNWCQNSVVIKHDDADKLKRVEKAFNEGRLCSEFIPLPNISAIDQASAWGTKWDISPSLLKARAKGNTVSLYFDSAWSPPTGLYDKLVEEGYNVDALYFEGGMAFYGRYLNGEDECSDFGSSKDIPDWIDEAFNVRETMLEFERENE